MVERSILPKGETSLQDRPVIGLVHQHTQWTGRRWEHNVLWSSAERCNLGTNFGWPMRLLLLQTHRMKEKNSYYAAMWGCRCFRKKNHPTWIPQFYKHKNYKQWDLPSIFCKMSTSLKYSEKNDVIDIKSRIFGARLPAFESQLC